LISPKDFNQFKTSDIAIAAVKLIGSFAAGSDSLKQTDYVTVRDFLLTNVSVANANSHNKKWPAIVRVRQSECPP